MSLRLIATLAVALSATSAYAADQDQPESSDGEFKIRPTISAAIGYNSNPESDTDPDPDGDFFNEDKIAIRATRKTNDLDLDMKFSGETRQYFEKTDSSSYAYTIEGSAEYTLNNQSSIGLEASREFSNDAGDELLIHSGAVAYKHDDDIAELRTTATLDSEDAILDEGDADNEFDYVKVGIETKATLLPNNAIAPFVKTKSSLIRHPQQDITIIDRNAVETSVAGGVRYKLEKSLEVSLGASYRLRRFNEAGVKARKGAYIEADLTWTPMEEFELSASAKRRFKEAEETGSYVRDVKEFEIAATAKPLDFFTNTASAKLAYENEVGASEKSRSLKFKDRASYELTSNFSVFAEVEQKWRKTNNAGVIEKERESIAMLGVEAEL